MTVNFKVNASARKPDTLGFEKIFLNILSAERVAACDAAVTFDHSVARHGLGGAVCVQRKPNDSRIRARNQRNGFIGGDFSLRDLRHRCINFFKCIFHNCYYTKRGKFLQSFEKDFVTVLSKKNHLPQVGDEKIISLRNQVEDFPLF